MCAASDWTVGVGIPKTTVALSRCQHKLWMSDGELLGLGFAIPHFHLPLSHPSLAMFFFLPLGMEIFSVIVIKSIKLGYFHFYKDTQIRVCLESQKRLGTFA